MKAFTFTYLNNYRNHGQNAEQSIRFHLTGESLKADNLRFDKGADVLNFQVKSAKATICKGTDLEKYLDLDASELYICSSLSLESSPFCISIDHVLSCSAVFEFSTYRL